MNLCYLFIYFRLFHFQGLRFDSVESLLFLCKLLGDAIHRHHNCNRNNMIISKSELALAPAAKINRTHTRTRTLIHKHIYIPFHIEIKCRFFFLACLPKMSFYVEHFVLKHSYCFFFFFVVLGLPHASANTHAHPLRKQMECVLYDDRTQM